MEMKYEEWMRMYNAERKYDLHKTMEKMFDLDDELVKLLKDWDGDSEITVALSNGWEFTNNGDGRDAIATIRDLSGNGSENDLLMFASLIMGNEELGWVDLDANDWEIKTQAILDDDCQFQYLQLTIQCTDWAS
jgi:hypothetical protein